MEALTKCGGAARWRTLRKLGTPDGQLRAAVRRGAVRVLGRGGFALPDAPLGLTVAIELGGVASHTTAAALRGWQTWNPVAQLVVTVPKGTSRSYEGVTVHRCGLRPEELDDWRACTAPLRTAVDCARTLELVDGVCILDCALRSRTVTEHQLRDAARRARGRGAPELRRAVAHMDPKADSILESVLRMLLVTAGCRFESQAWIPGVGPVDFLVNGWLIVEGDGFEFHSSRADYRNDRRRLNESTALGYGLLRFTWEDVRFRPLWVVDEVRRVQGLRSR